MPASALPWFEEADYTRLQQIIPELKHDSYPEWVEEHRKAVAYRRSRNGSTDIAISAEEFAEWLEVTRQKAHLELLWVYAEDKAARV